jgi:hypothetical protein
MRLPRLQFTVGRMVAVVGVFGGLLGLALEIQRRGEAFRKLAVYHRESAHLVFERAGMPGFCNNGQSQSEIEQAYASHGMQVWLNYQAGKYHNRMADKYELAADRPWLPVGADPPPPPGAYTTFEEAAERIDYFFRAGWRSNIN